MAYGIGVKAFAAEYKGLGYVRGPSWNGVDSGTTIQCDIDGRGRVMQLDLSKATRSDEFVLELIQQAYRRGMIQGRDDQIQETRTKYLAFIDSFSGRADY